MTENDFFLALAHFYVRHILNGSTVFVNFESEKNVLVHSASNAPAGHGLTDSHGVSAARFEGP